MVPCRPLASRGFIFRQHRQGGSAQLEDESPLGYDAALRHHDRASDLAPVCHFWQIRVDCRVKIRRMFATL